MFMKYFQQEVDLLVCYYYYAEWDIQSIVIQSAWIARRLDNQGKLS